MAMTVATTVALVACALTLFTGVASAQCAHEELRTGASAALPDCRGYEQVSPTNKGGFAAYHLGTAFPVQVSPDGEAISYLNYSSFPGALGNTALAAAHLSTRTASGWQTTELTPAVPKAETLKQYIVGYAFSENLSEVVIKAPRAPLVPGATPEAYNLFLRHSNGSYTLLNSAPRKSVDELCQGPLCFFEWDVSTFAGASNNFSHVLIESNAAMTTDAQGVNAEEDPVASLYESAGGKVSLVGILPDGKAAETSSGNVASTAGSGSSLEYVGVGESELDGRVENAISENGSRIVFEAPADGGIPDAAQKGDTEVYDRLNGQSTIELSAPAPETGKPPAVTTAEPATFWAASADGSHVFFTSAAELTTQSNTGLHNSGEDLYEYNLETKKLTDLTIDTNALDATTGAMVQGVVGASKSGAYVYFVADGQLVSGKGTDGQPNLYYIHENARGEWEVPHFITTLAGESSCSFKPSGGDGCDWTQTGAMRTAYVTPNGAHIAFTSTKNMQTANFPHGYDNSDQVTGTADSEVYEYSVPEGTEAGSGRLVCGSCNPSGEKPTGDEFIGGVVPVVFENGEVYKYAFVGTPFAQVRAVSESGNRLFFDGPGPTSSPAYKAYEYEQSNEGTCASSLGCVYSLSSPTSPEEDYFLGADETGSNAFIATNSRLVPADSDNLTDIYDARIEGGTPLTAESRCESSCHEGGAISPEAPSFVSGVTGVSGNLAPVTPKVTPIPIPLTNAQKLSKELKVCRTTKRTKKKRRACEAAARKRYSPQKAKKSSDRRVK